MGGLPIMPIAWVVLGLQCLAASGFCCLRPVRGPRILAPHCRNRALETPVHHQANVHNSHEFADGGVGISWSFLLIG